MFSFLKKEDNMREIKQPSIVNVEQKSINEYWMANPRFVDGVKLYPACVDNSRCVITTKDGVPSKITDYIDTKVLEYFDTEEACKDYIDGCKRNDA